MARPRTRDRDLPVGLYRDARSGVFYVRAEGASVSLRTRERAEALELHAIWRAEIERARRERDAQALAGRFRVAANPAGRETVAEHCRAWREQALPSATARRGGTPLAEKTRADYARMLRMHVEPAPELEVALADLSRRHVARFLAHWMSHPAYYNYLLALLRVVLEAAVDAGKLDRNPAREVRRRAVGKRRTYITHEAYIAITGRMDEWLARACDLVYALSHNPVDVLALRESDIERGAGGGVVHLRRRKTGQAVDIEFADEDGIGATLAWLGAWKAAQGLLTPHLVAYPRTASAGRAFRRRRLIGQPLTVAYLSAAWRRAAEAAGYAAGEYRLQDLRPKGLTDDWLAGGDSDKGAHLTEAMRRHYRRVEVPMRARNNVRSLRTGD